MAAAALPPCSALRALSEPGCWLCSPGLQHHRIQCLPEINLPVKHCQDSSSQALLSSCCRTRWGRGSISNAPWWGLLNKSILAQRQHCPCGVACLCVCVPALLRRRPVLACCAGATGPQGLLHTAGPKGVPVLHAGPCPAAGHAVQGAHIAGQPGLEEGGQSPAEPQHLAHLCVSPQHSNPNHTSKKTLFILL